MFEDVTERRLLELEARMAAAEVRISNHIAAPAFRAHGDAAAARDSVLGPVPDRAALVSDAKNANERANRLDAEVVKLKQQLEEEWQKYGVLLQRYEELKKRSGEWVD